MPFDFLRKRRLKGERALDIKYVSESSLSPFLLHMFHSDKHSEDVRQQASISSRKLSAILVGP